LNKTWNWSPKPTKDEVEDKKLMRWQDAPGANAALGVDVDSDPICSSAGCDYENKKDKHEVTYKTDGPLEPSIIDTHTHMK